MAFRASGSTIWLLTANAVLWIGVACSGASDTKKKVNPGDDFAGDSQGGNDATPGSGGLAAAGNAGELGTPSAGADGLGGSVAGEGGAAGQDLGGGSSMRGGEATGGGTSGSGGSSGSAGAANGGTGGSATTVGCIRAVNDAYVVRADGRVLVEQRDTTKETTVLDGAGQPLADAVDAAVGAYHGCALLSGGTVACWREQAGRGNWVGQLGNGNVDTNANAPLQHASQVLIDVGVPLTGVTALTRGGPALQSTCAITADRQLYCWGDLAWLINAGTALSSPYAQAITTNGIDPLTGVEQASTSVNMACAIVKQGAARSLYCWGANEYHNLATGDVLKRQYPTKVTSLLAPTVVGVVDYNYALSSGGTACAVDSGKLLCWGANGSGQTGTNTSGADVPTPTQVVIQDGTTPLPPPVGITGIANTFCALAGNKTVWCWGAYFNAAAGNYGATNVALLGGPVAGASNLYWLMYATNDGQFHWGKEWARTPGCDSP